MLLLLQGGAAQVAHNGALALTVIPLLILYFGLIAWLTYDASQDSNWFIWLLAFLLLGPVSIPFYIVTSLMARRGTPQHVLDARAEEKRKSPYKFVSEVERSKWIAGLDPEHGTMWEPTLGMSLSAGRHDHYLDDTAQQLLAKGDEAGAFGYLTELYEIAREQGDIQRAAGLRHLVESRIDNGPERFRQWEKGETYSAPVSVPRVQDRSTPF
jgi:hypothetical protein